MLTGFEADAESVSLKDKEEEPETTMEMTEVNALLYQLQKRLTSSDQQDGQKLFNTITRALDAPYTALGDVKLPQVLKSSSKKRSTKRMKTAVELEEERIKAKSKKQKKIEVR
jgi:hypothetical protein